MGAKDFVPVPVNVPVIHTARPNYQLSILNYQLNKGLYVSMSKKLSVENMNYVRQGLRSRSR